MREIKFRAKEIETGRWIYGWVFGKNVKSIVELDTGYISKVRVEAYYTTVVDPETIGQYTGLKDKNGKEIYEGDIVTAWSQGYQATGEVKQRIDGLWLMYPAYQHGKQWGLCPNPKGATTVEIIGNIHDNPEVTE